MTLSEAHAVFAVQELANRGAKPKTCANYEWTIHSLVRHIGDIEVSLLGIDHIIYWKLQLRDNGMKPASINTLLARLRCLLKWLHEHEFRTLDYTKITREPEPTQQPRTFLTPDEVNQLKAVTTTARDYALISLYFSTGCRLSEILDLDRRDFTKAELVDDMHQVYQLWVCGKNSKYRPVYFDEATRRAVAAYLDDRSDNFRPLFISNQNRRLSGSRVQDLVHDLTRRAGLDKHVTPHVLRHSFCSDLLMNNAPIAGVSELMGHARQTTTLNIYSHINQRQKITTYAKSHSRL